MRRFARRTGGTTKIHTTNGVKTTTTPFYARRARTFKPRADGYNEALAEAMWAQIMMNRSLWQQSVWRKVFVGDEALEAHAIDVAHKIRDVGQSTFEALPHAREQIQEELSRALQFEVDSTEPLCGTAMCAAGWVGELSAADFIVDLDVARVLSTAGVDETWWPTDTLLVAKSYLKTVNTSRSGEHGHYEDDYIPWTSMSYIFRSGAEVPASVQRAVMKALKARGFEPKTHVVVEVDHWAVHKLGLTNLETVADEIPLFKGSNDLEAIRRHLDAYAMFGPGTHELDLYDEAKRRTVYVPTRLEADFERPWRTIDYLVDFRREHLKGVLADA